MTHRPLRFARLVPGIYMSKMDLAQPLTYGIEECSAGWMLSIIDVGEDRAEVLGTYGSFPAARAAAVAHRDAALA